MTKVFTDKIQIRKKGDNLYIISIALSDDTLVIKELTEREVRLLGIAIDKLVSDMEK